MPTSPTATVCSKQMQQLERDGVKQYKESDYLFNLPSGRTYCYNWLRSRAELGDVL
jgi:hypothetical protein